MVELESVELFRGLSRKELADLREISREKRIPAGTVIFREGDRCDGLYIIRDGQVEIAHLVGREVRNVFSQVGPGEIFGEMAVIEQEPRSASTVATQDTLVYFISREEIRMLLQHSPGLAFNMLQEISRRLREFNQTHLRAVVQAERLAVIGRFAQGVVHDLKNPLSIIGLSAEMFNMPTLRPEVRAKTHARIKKQVERIGAMVGDILIFTDTEKANIKLSRVYYGDFILGLIEDLRDQTELKDVKIELQGEPPKARVMLDPRRLGRVFHNLTNNATDVMFTGGKIFLRFTIDNNEIITEIEDTGPGIPKEIADKLFQPFATHGKTHGTGLGLSICKKIIEDHGGRIWTRASPGHGAIFCFALPLSKWL